MTIPDRRTRFDPNQGSEPVARPRIWVEGRQRPQFDLRAYLATSLGIARRDLAPEIHESATRLQGFAARVQRGDLRLTVAWAQRVLPSHQRMAGWISGLARLMADSRRLIVEEEATPPPAPATPRPPVEPTLHAIRSALGDVPHDGHTSSRPIETEGGVLWRAAARAVLWILLAFALPAGAIKALVYHLDGGDLANWF